MELETKLSQVKEADRMFSRVRSDETLTEEERSSNVDRAFDLFKDLDQTQKNLLMKRHLHTMVFSFLRRDEPKCLRHLALNVNRHYEFPSEEVPASIAALAKGYHQQVTPDRRRAILDCICAIAKPSLQGAFESSLAFARAQDPSAVDCIKGVYSLVDYRK